MWTVKPILCMAPIQFKGWPWLAARQGEVCNPNGLHEYPRMLPSTMDTTADNDLMVGDDPNAGQLRDLVENEDFIPVNSPRAKRADSAAATDTDSMPNDEAVEGSGADDIHEGSGADDAETTEASASPTKLVNLDDDDQISNETQSDEDDRSASDAIILDNVPTTLQTSENASVEEAAAAATTIPEVSEPVTVTVPPTSSTPEPAPVPVAETVPVVPLATVETTSQTENSNDGDASTALPPIIEEPAVVVKNMANMDAEYVQTNDGHEKASSTHSEETKIDETAEVHEGNSTYVLLAILGILLVALILYVAAKRSKTNTKNRRNNNDIESPAQEMLTMDKNNLGKPMQNPVEFIPLIDPEKKAQINKCNGEEPLLHKLTEVEHEHEPNHAAANGNGIAGGVKKANDGLQQQTAPTHQLNGNAKPIANGTATEPTPVDSNKSTDEHDQPQFQPISPKPSRYSPVS